MSSDSSGELPCYGWFDNISRKQHSGKGDFFLPPESGDSPPVDKTYLTAYRQQLPEIVSSADTIKILTEDDRNFGFEKDIVTTFSSIEKSMYQVISKEMINMFSTIVDFNNVVGEPVNRYRGRYKALEKLREIFFRKVTTTSKVEKFIEYYRWLDDAIAIIVSERGVKLARRTVAKYRDMLKIPSSSERRRRARLAMAG